MGRVGLDLELVGSALLAFMLDEDDEHRGEEDDDAHKGEHDAHDLVSGGGERSNKANPEASNGAADDIDEQKNAHNNGALACVVKPADHGDLLLVTSAHTRALTG